MANYKDKDVVAMQALKSSASEEDSLSGEHKILTDFEKNVRTLHTKSLKKLKKLVGKAKKIYDQIFIPTLECTEQIEMNSVVKNYKMYDQQLIHREQEILKNKTFAINKVRLFGGDEVIGNRLPYIMSFLLIIFFICIESVINSSLLSQASESGLIGGALLASAISSISVIFSVLCGRSFQALYTGALFQKIFAWIIFTFWASCSLVAHLSIGWYRYALENHSDQASTAWFQLLQEHLYRQPDFWAWVLTITGLILATKAFHIGCGWNGDVLLSKLRKAERRIEKLEIKRIRKMMDAKKGLENIKRHHVHQDIFNIIGEASKLQNAFELYRIEIIELANKMDEYIVSRNKDIVAQIDIWRSNYISQNPNAKFPSEILQVDIKEYSLHNHPIIQWINSIDNKDIEKAINRMREKRIEQIIQTYENMCNALYSNTVDDMMDVYISPQEQETKESQIEEINELTERRKVNV